MALSRRHSEYKQAVIHLIETWPVHNGHGAALDGVTETLLQHVERAFETFEDDPEEPPNLRAI